jgi:hypothetical protein
LLSDAPFASSYSHPAIPRVNYFMASMIASKSSHEVHHMPEIYTRQVQVTFIHINPVNLDNPQLREYLQ